MTEPADAGAPVGDPLPVRFANTLHAVRGTVHDDLDDARGLSAWLAASGLPVARVTRDDLAAARDLRDALRRVLAHVTGDDRPAARATGTVAAGEAGVAAALEVLDAHRRARPRDRLALVDGRVVREEPLGDGGAGAALARVADEAAALLAGTDSPAVRACGGPRCVVYFVRDHPRREWCSRACGERARAARYYRRRRAGSGTA
ncbi:ABATE domain-containing protein [Kineococcus terrestris]|uniref:ABATE domain-containing protein n=1 Tax=Kineococcus terrestris TaxID=2044856 RepID=UPI0034DAF93A